MEEEKDGLKLWQPQDTDFVRDTVWLRETFPSKTRFSSIIILAENVLEPEVVRQTYSLLNDIKSAKNNSDDSTPLWEQKCMKTAFGACLEMSILEAFMTPAHQYDADAITGLSSVQKVADTVNSTALSGVTDGPFRPHSYLGSVTYNNGKIVGAKAMLLNLMGINEGDQKGDEGSLLFEEKLISLVNERSYSGGMQAYPLTMRSFNDLIGGSIASDLSSLASGYLLIYLYVLINLGKRNSVEQRVWLSITGIAAVMMGVGTSFGLASFMGVFSTGMNQLLPFLMLGVGIDDMFVIMQAFENLDPDERKLDLATRFGLTMKHAGVAVTITSVTDFLAFAIGASTVLPALSSFCIFAALGILFIYFYAITFFLAWFSLDQRRVEDTRDGCLCCWKKQKGFLCCSEKKDWTPSQCSQKSMMSIMFEKLAGVVVLLPVKVGIILATLAILAGGVFGAVTLESFFDYNSWIEEGTYLSNYLDYSQAHFPTDGKTSNIYLTDLDYATDMEDIGRLVEDLNQLAAEGRENIAPGSINSWFTAFVPFVNQLRSTEFGDQSLPTFKGYTNASFLTDLSAFLNNPAEGGSYRNVFKFASDADFSKPAPQVLLSSISYKHVPFPNSQPGVVAMKEVFAIIDKYEFSARVFATSQEYGSYITMDIITEELYRNILMALAVVFLCTIILIADLATSIIVLVTVTLTVVNVAGYANFWGLSIDTLFAIFMTISIGLCVDYSAHIAHGFMVEEGTRDERMKKTLVKIGPAVLNGGISTFLAFVLLSMSKSVIFLTFFKIFFLVVVFGLFHGLLFLPVVLSLVGPRSHGHHDDNITQVGPLDFQQKEETNQGFQPDNEEHYLATPPPTPKYTSPPPPPPPPLEKVDTIEMTNEETELQEAVVLENLLQSLSSLSSANDSVPIPPKSESLVMDEPTESEPGPTKIEPLFQPAPIDEPTILDEVKSIQETSPSAKTRAESPSSKTIISVQPRPNSSTDEKT